MPLDPQVQTMLDAMREMGMDSFEADMSALEPAQLRQLMEERRVPAPVEEVARVEDRAVPGPDGLDLPIRIYWPADDGGVRPVVVFFHGGGWVIGSIESHDATVRSLTNQVGAVFVSVEYRLGPEHRYPAAVEDCYVATRWVADNAASIGVDPTRLAVAGDSAGGNLAAVVALIARDRGGPPIAFQLLVYPCTDMDPDRWPSMRENANGYFLTTTAMEWFYGHYADEDRRREPCASPVRAEDLSGLPPALVITAEYDPLRDEGEAYAARLREAGVEVSQVRYDGQVHGFFSMTAMLDRAKEAQAHAAEVARRALRIG